MAHNLGMHHDGSDKEITKKCDSNGYIMSPSRGTSKENTWSTCSKEAMNSFVLPCLNEGETKMAKTLDHSKYELAPGQVWDAYEQCKLLLKNNDATLYNTTVLQLVCEKVICKIPTREGYYSSGPALEGTYCGSKNWCVKGNCEPWGSKNLEVVKGGWTEWKLGDCTSGCIKNSKGVITGTRTCTNPRPKNSVTCDGPTYKISLCDDSAICSKREDPINYAKNMCTKLQKYISDLSGEGVQVKHSASTDACSLFCKLKSTGSWYNPSYELNDVVGADTKFPDGTWCHKENDIDYFCQKGKCLPAEKNTRSLSERQTANNNPKPGNALPNEKEVIEELRKGGNPSILDTDDSDIWKDDNDEVTIPVDDNSV
ncbi:A disintegrin and metalloproteinase with thrombospondin motifs adt-2-like [Tachypleus tridentatus]|uniref:A disintegrin and metalloproteinase with thrombospondin motifs adt-2-like n=1 Tax=Tachypleus tridentatus TaxID=6853 RepID=UPI003FD3D94A